MVLGLATLIPNENPENLLALVLNSVYKEGSANGGSPYIPHVPWSSAFHLIYCFLVRVILHF